jgi:starch phosphorylase
LRRIAAAHPVQLIFAGKAHPRDEPGKHGIRSVLQAARQLGDAVSIVYLADYDLELALGMVSGVDLWLNTPQRPLEASATSGMKAALNGVPSFSVLDGWWREGCVEGVTGWAIGASDPVPGDDSWQADAVDLYRKLETVVAPLFYADRNAWVRIMRHCIALNGSFFQCPSHGPSVRPARVLAQRRTMKPYKLDTARYRCGGLVRMPRCCPRLSS